MDRHKFDAELGKTAAKNGTHIILGTKVSSLLVKVDYVEAQLKTPQGEKQVRSKIAVIATGISFNLQASLGMGRPKKITKGIKVEVIAQDLKRLQIYWGR